MNGGSDATPRHSTVRTLAAPPDLRDKGTDGRAGAFSFGRSIRERMASTSFRRPKTVRHFVMAASLAALLLSAAPARATEPRYEPDLLQLSTVLGSVQYLRKLCGEDTAVWRDEMTAVLDAENPDAATRARLVASFNRGYRAYSAIYTVCTPAAVESISRLMKQGRALAAQIVARYGN